jgi:hypothetical protein
MRLVPGHPAEASLGDVDLSVAAAEDDCGVSSGVLALRQRMRGRSLRSRLVIPHRVTRHNASRTIALLILLVP